MNMTNFSDSVLICNKTVLNSYGCDTNGMVCIINAELIIFFKCLFNVAFVK